MTNQNKDLPHYQIATTATVWMMHDLEQRQSRLMIGRLASLNGPPPDLSAWAAEREQELFILPVLPDDALSDSVSTASSEGYRRSALVTVWGAANSDTPGIRLVWLAVETTIETSAGGGVHLPITSATTVADILGAMVACIVPGCCGNP